MVEALSIACKKVCHIEDFDYAVEGKIFQAKKLAVGPLSGYRCSFKVGHTVLECSQVHSRILLTGQMPEHLITLVFPTTSQAFYHNAKRIEGFNHFSIMPGKKAYKISSMSARYFSITLDIHRLRQLLPLHKANDLISYCEQLEHLQASASKREAFLQYLEFLYEALSVPEPTLSGPIESIERELIDCLYDYLVDIHLHKESRSNRRGEIFFKALQIVNDQTNGAISVADLADQVHVSIRTLQYIFDEHMSITPRACIRHLKMNAIRRELLDRGGYAPGKIRALVNTYGVVHMGNFAKSYRDLFDETPRQTLERRRLN